jgi:hypothetical protein
VSSKFAGQVKWKPAGLNPAGFLYRNLSSHDCHDCAFALKADVIVMKSDATRCRSATVEERPRG